ncbi:Hypothetical protein FKW44_022418 [Caligus rogercresseyi]|uniref:Uncharacterized protein n=1 Tax=Caligus rogercresseyi TaxID=217165 RepID=A0A7T8GN39_CALRO|nr:Hypothetical protein FKW44_022418 [Caligus rogercresseyi]
MRDVYGNLEEIVFSEEERRCAVVAILVSMKGMISNSVMVDFYASTKRPKIVKIPEGLQRST